MTNNLCLTCGHASTSLLVITAKDARGRWVDYQYCRPCAKHNGDLDDERAQRAIEQAERAGV